MSSAILYLAIVAIWACVLIPRWLRRDSAHGAATAFAGTDTPDDCGVPDTGLGDADLGDADLADAGLGDAGFAEADVASETMAAALPPGEAGEAPRPLPVRLTGRPPDRLPDPLSAEESRRRMLTARRRLLGMLIALEAAAVALAFMGLAALWVVVPPTVMLAGYLLLLREAARADAEHAQRAAAAAAAAAARDRARARARMRAWREDSAPAAHYPTPAERVPLAARFAAAPVPADYEASGRDFAPGLAGKYIPSNANSERTDEEQYGYDEPRFRRAVGD